MSDMVENQSFVPAASSAPAAGEASTQAPTEQNKPQGQAPANTNTAEPPKDARTPQTGEGEDGGEDEERGKRPSRSQRLQRKAQLLAAENEQLRRQMAEGARPQQQQQDAPQRPKADAKADDPNDPRPKEDDFKGDFLGFMRAEQRWEARQDARQIARETIEGAQRESAQSEHASFIRDRVLDYREQADELRERMPDYDALQKKGLPFEPKRELTLALLDSDKSALLELHLIKNPDKARELNALTGDALARAIGRLEGSLRLPAARKATEADPPPTPLTGGGAKPSFDPFKAEMDEFAAHWNARETAKREARFK